MAERLLRQRQRIPPRSSSPSTPTDARWPMPRDEPQRNRRAAATPTSCSSPKALSGFQTRSTASPTSSRSSSRGAHCSEAHSASIKRVTTSIARLVAPGGSLKIVLSVVERDRAAVGAERPFSPSDVDAMADSIQLPLGLDLTNARRLSPDEIRATGSTWARRLRSDDSRSIYRVELTLSRSSSYRSFTDKRVRRRQS